MPIKMLKAFLDSHYVKYLAIPHFPTYTAQETAASADIPGREMAKTVMVKIDGEMAMAVLPAPYQIDMHLLKKSIGADSVELAEEYEFAGMFPDCEVGAMPPFGNLFGMDVFVDRRLTEDDEIVFEAGSATELIKMKYMDYSRLVKPIVYSFSMEVKQFSHAA